MYKDTDEQELNQVKNFFSDVYLNFGRIVVNI